MSSSQGHIKIKTVLNNHILKNSSLTKACKGRITL